MVLLRITGTVSGLIISCWAWILITLYWGICGLELVIEILTRTWLSFIFELIGIGGHVIISHWAIVIKNQPLLRMAAQFVTFWSVLWAISLVGRKRNWEEISSRGLRVNFGRNRNTEIYIYCIAALALFGPVKCCALAAGATALAAGGPDVPSRACFKAGAVDEFVCPSARRLEASSGSSSPQPPLASIFGFVGRLVDITVLRNVHTGSRNIIGAGLLLQLLPQLLDLHLET